MISGLQIIAARDLNAALAHAAKNPAHDVCAVLVHYRLLNESQAAWIRAAAAKPADPGVKRGETVAVCGPETGRDLLHFEIYDSLARGASGEVFRALDRRRGHEVALKLLKPKSLESQARQRFEREAAILARVAHPNIVRVFDYGFAEDRGYLSMELVRGASLDLRLRRDPPSRAEILGVFLTMARVLAYIHELGVFHRDFKPANVLIEESGRAVLIDFGLAKAGGGIQQDLGQESVTRKGQMLGTPAFMSPEQLEASRGRGTVGPATDVWSFGAALLYSLTGELPFAARSAIEQFVQLAREDARRLKDLAPELPDWIDGLCNACMQRRVSDRVGMAQVIALMERRGVGDGLRL